MDVSLRVITGVMGGGEKSSLNKNENPLSFSTIMISPFYHAGSTLRTQKGCQVQDFCCFEKFLSLSQDASCHGAGTDFWHISPSLCESTPFFRPLHTCKARGAWKLKWDLPGYLFFQEAGRDFFCLFMKCGCMNIKNCATAQNRRVGIITEHHFYIDGNFLSENLY